MKQRAIRKACVDAIRHMFISEEDFSFATRALELAANTIHVMEFTRMRTMEAMFSLIRKGIENIFEYNESTDFPIEGTQIGAFMTKWVVFSAIWGIGGSMNLATRTNFSNRLADFTETETPALSSGVALIDYEIRLSDQKWHLWRE
jgi:dynein heavy chain 1, cytosolic